MRTPDAFTPPPPHSARFRSDDLDEIQAFIAAYDGSHRRNALDSGPLGYSVHAVRCGNVDIGWGTTRARQKIRGTPQVSILQLPLGRRHGYATSGRTFETGPDTAILLAPGQEYTLYFEPDDCLVLLRIPGVALANEIRERDPVAALASQGTCEVPLASGRRDALAAMHRALVDATHPLARVGDRWLESAFRSHRGQTPLQFVTGRRLSRVRGRLLDSRPGDPMGRTRRHPHHVDVGIKVGRGARLSVLQVRWARCRERPNQQLANSDEGTVHFRQKVKVPLL